MIASHDRFWQYVSYLMEVLWKEKNAGQEKIEEQIMIEENPTVRTIKALNEEAGKKDGH